MQTTTTIRHRKDQVAEAEKNYQRALEKLEGEKEALDVFLRICTVTYVRKSTQLLRNIVQFVFRMKNFERVSTGSKRE